MNDIIDNWSNKTFKVTVVIVNQTFTSLHGRSLEITLTIPLTLSYEYIINGIKDKNDKCIKNSLNASILNFPFTYNTENCVGCAQYTLVYRVQ